MGDTILVTVSERGGTHHRRESWSHEWPDDRWGRNDLAELLRDYRRDGLVTSVTVSRWRSGAPRSITYRRPR